MQEYSNPTLPFIERKHAGSANSTSSVQNKFDDFIETSIQANRFFGQMIPVFYLLDHRTGKYERITDSFAGYHTAAFLNSGVQLMLNIVDTQHLRLYDQKIFPERLKILSGIEPKEHQNYIFSLNSTLTHRMGYRQDFLQRNCYISDETGNPLFSMGILINLDHYNDRYPIIQTVEKIDPSGIELPKVVYKRVFFNTCEKQFFSSREIEVLNFMADGLSSKQIANKMFLSEHTIINHRRNMQEKSKQPNAVSLIIFAVKQGFI